MKDPIVPPLVGRVRLSNTTIRVLNQDGEVNVGMAPLTPEQSILTLYNYALFDSEKTVPEMNAGQMTIAPILVGEECYGVIRFCDHAGRGASILLSPADFSIVTNQFVRTTDIMAMEQTGRGPAAHDPAPPPFGEGRSPGREPLDKGDGPQWQPQHPRSTRAPASPSGSTGSCNKSTISRRSSPTPQSPPPNGSPIR